MKYGNVDVPLGGGAHLLRGGLLEGATLRRRGGRRARSRGGSDDRRNELRRVDKRMGR